MATSNLTRLSINVNQDTAQALRDLAKQNETTVTEIVRRAVAVYKFFDEAEDAHKTIQLVDQDKNVTAVQMLV